MRTAIDELINSLENGFLENRFNNSNDIIKEFNKFKEKEKHNIIQLSTEAHELGLTHKDYSAEEYYNMTFY